MKWRQRSISFKRDRLREVRRERREQTDSFHFGRRFAKILEEFRVFKRFKLVVGSALCSLHCHILIWSAPLPSFFTDGIQSHLEAFAAEGGFKLIPFLTKGGRSLL